MYSAWSVIAGEQPTATKWNLLGSNDADFDTRITQLVADKTVGSFSDGATITLNMATRKIWKGQIAGNRTITFSNASDLIPFVVIVQQDGTGGRSITWSDNANIVWMTLDGSAPAPAQGASKYTIYVFIPLTSSTWLGQLVSNN